MLTFAWPWLLLVLPFPALVYLFVPPAAGSKTALHVPFYQSVSALCDLPGHRLPPSKLVLLSLVWVLLVVAVARPQWVGETVNVPITGRDLMLAVDVSGSMKARDMIFRNQPQNRLSAVKRVAGDFITNRVGDRVGLVLFGTRAYLQAPLTLDRDTVNTLLQESAIGIAGEKTAIGDAIGLALKRLKDRPGTDRVLILLTDGSNTAGTIDPLKAAELAQVAGLRIHTIGVGSDRRQTQNLFGSARINPSAELDERTLAQIAALTAGRYFRARDAAALSEIYALIDELEPVEEDTSHLRPTRDLFYLPLAASALLSLILALWWGGLIAVPRPMRRSRLAVGAEA